MSKFYFTLLLTLFSFNVFAAQDKKLPIEVFAGLKSISQVKLSPMVIILPM
ncbi:hypothetical protein ACOBV8_13400 [Pseudoalteromonas espejiana]